MSHGPAPAKHHEYVRIIEYSLQNPSFSIQQACEASGLSPRRFRGAMYSIFSLRGKHEQLTSDHEVVDWELSPDAYFNYLSFLEYQHSLQTAARARRTAAAAVVISIAGIVISSLIAAAGLLSG